MRIIAGSRKRMLLIGPKDLTTRPITDRVKESLFAILSPNIEGAVVADLFCGTGSLGLESLSRGVLHAIMVDDDIDAVKRLRKNVAKLQFEKQTTIIKTDAFKSAVPAGARSDMAKHLSQNATINLVFIDPPYAQTRNTSPDSKLAKLLIKLNEQISHQALVVIRHEKRSELLRQYADLHLWDRREYGNMALTFLQKIDSSGDK